MYMRVVAKKLSLAPQFFPYKMDPLWYYLCLYAFVCLHVKDNIGYTSKQLVRFQKSEPNPVSPSAVRRRLPPDGGGKGDDVWLACLKPNELFGSVAISLPLSLSPCLPVTTVPPRRKVELAAQWALGRRRRGVFCDQICLTMDGLPRRFTCKPVLKRLFQCYFIVISLLIQCYFNVS